MISGNILKKDQFEDKIIITWENMLQNRPIVIQYLIKRVTFLLCRVEFKFSWSSVKLYFFLTSSIRLSVKVTRYIFLVTKFYFIFSCIVSISIIY